MFINLIVFICFFFVIRLFFFLAKKYNRHLFLNTLFGALSFLVSYFVFSVVSINLFSLAFDNLSFSNEIVMGCFTIPFAMIISGIYYKFLENKFKKRNKKSTINQIGNE
jgi:uncharacterized membrane protein YqhA